MAIPARADPLHDPDPGNPRPGDDALPVPSKDAVLIKLSVHQSPGPARHKVGPRAAHHRKASNDPSGMAEPPAARSPRWIPRTGTAGLTSCGSGASTSVRSPGEQVIPRAHKPSHAKEGQQGKTEAVRIDCSVSLRFDEFATETKRVIGDMRPKCPAVTWSCVHVR
jgi:hypothetical protein